MVGQVNGDIVFMIIHTSAFAGKGMDGIGDARFRRQKLSSHAGTKFFDEGIPIVARTPLPPFEPVGSAGVQGAAGSGNPAFPSMDCVQEAICRCR